MSENNVNAKTEESVRIKQRAAGPLEKAINIFTTTDYSAVIKKHNDIVKEISDSPLDWYFDARKRLEKDGAVAQFPEFEGVVAKLTEVLFQNKDYVDEIKKDATLQQMLDIQIHSLLAIQIKDRYLWPYKATILVIEEMLKIIDIISRKKRADAPKYYHNFRYRLYLTYLLDEASPQNIVFPTIYSIGTTFFIKVRCAPIYFLGVVNDFAHADQYDNSPLDFWAHDIQHARRLIQEDRRYYDIIVKHSLYYVKRSPFDYISYDNFLIEMFNFTKEILPLILVQKSDSDEIKAYKQINKLLVFEVIHEKGWPITKFSLCRNIPLGYDIFPIEVLDVDATDRVFITIENKFNDPTTLSNLYNKLRKGFYDKVDKPDPKILLPTFRTARHIATAALKILEHIKCNKKYSIENLMALTQDLKGAEEFTERAGTIDYANNRNNNSVTSKFPTQTMPYWQVEEEAPIISGGYNKNKKTKKNNKK